ncbi:hypothetical protein ACHAWF_011240 [Thalassiosira exigua]
MNLCSVTISTLSAYNTGIDRFPCRYMIPHWIQGQPRLPVRLAGRPVTKSSSIVAVTVIECGL